MFTRLATDVVKFTLIHVSASNDANTLGSLVDSVFSIGGFDSPL